MELRWEIKSADAGAYEALTPCRNGNAVAQTAGSLPAWSFVIVSDERLFQTPSGAQVSTDAGAVHFTAASPV